MTDVMIVGDRDDGAILDDVLELMAPKQLGRRVLFVVVALVGGEEEQVRILLLEIIDDC